MRQFLITCLVWAACGHAAAQSLKSDQLEVQIGANGEIASLQVAGDAFPTNYVLNAQNARALDTADHAWVGELMLSYRTGTGAWQTALTSQSADVRKVTQASGAIQVSYEGSKSESGVRDFKLVEGYAMQDGALRWSIDLTNSGSQPIEIGDLGLPLPFNEYWAGRDVIYEQRVVYHSFTGQNGSYITIKRPSGVGPFVLMMPDTTTDAGFEYMDAWREEEHRGSAWAAGAWSNGLDVFYIHSNVIKSTERGYLPNTSAMLMPGETKSYAFKFFKVASQDEVQQRLFSEGSIDFTVLPGMVFASDMTAQFDLHTSKPITSVDPQYPMETTLTPVPNADPTRHVYALTLSHLGQNDLTVNYGEGQKTTLQFYVIEPVEAALARHATFMVEHTVSQDMSHPLYKVFDDWMMDTKARRGQTGSWGWGDDWGWTHGQFLAEKNALTPVASEAQALDDYLNAVWGTQIDKSTFAVNDWFCPPGMTANCVYDRPFAYPHVFNTYFSMYKVASLYPQLIKYRESADTYLMRSYGVLNALYSRGGDPGTGYMGEQTLPDIIQALEDNKHKTEADFVRDIVSRLHDAFKSSPYPYGSEYNYDNTGEEAVYMAARFHDDKAVQEKVNAKTRACRGQEPVWYYYADPVTLNGENWWQFQYSAALIGYCMDDWLRTHSETPELDERLSYAAKLANLTAINSGQIDAAPENIGTIAWTYQAMKGKTYMGNAEKGMLHNGWRQMSGEADLGLFGALRILSSDVAVDPIFGLYCYGCEVKKTGACYDVTPKDGVAKRLNLITEKLNVELQRDRYMNAQLGTHNDYVSLTLQNQSGDAHTTKLSVRGLSAGDHPVSVDGMSVGMLTAQANEAASVQLNISAEPMHTITVGMPCDATAIEPSGSAGAGGVVALPSAGTGAAVGGGAGSVGATAASSGRSAPSTTSAGAGRTGSSDSAITATPAADSGAPDAAAASGCSCRIARGARTSFPGVWLAMGSMLFARRLRRRLGAQRRPISHPPADSSEL